MWKEMVPPAPLVLTADAQPNLAHLTARPRAQVGMRRKTSWKREEKNNMVKTPPEEGNIKSFHAFTAAVSLSSSSAVYSTKLRLMTNCIGWRCIYSGLILSDSPPSSNTFPPSPFFLFCHWYLHQAWVAFSNLPLRLIFHGQGVYLFSVPVHKPQ